MEGFSVDEEIFLHNNAFSCTILKYGLLNFNHSGPIGPDIWLVELATAYLNLHRKEIHKDLEIITKICFPGL